MKVNGARGDGLRATRQPILPVRVPFPRVPGDSAGIKPISAPNVI